MSTLAQPPEGGPVPVPVHMHVPVRGHPRVYVRVCARVVDLLDTVRLVRLYTAHPLSAACLASFSGPAWMDRLHLIEGEDHP